MGFPSPHAGEATASARPAATAPAMLPLNPLMPPAGWPTGRTYRDAASDAQVPALGERSVFHLWGGFPAVQAQGPYRCPEISSTWWKVPRFCHGNGGVSTAPAVFGTISSQSSGLSQVA